MTSDLWERLNVYECGVVHLKHAILALEEAGLLQHEERMMPASVHSFGPTASPRIEIASSVHAPDCRACALVKKARE